MHWTVSVCTSCRSKQKSLIPRLNQPQITPYFHVYTSKYVCMYVCISSTVTCVYACACVRHVCMCASCICGCVCVHVCMRVHVHVCVGACVNVCKWGPDWNQHDPKIPQGLMSLSSVTDRNFDHTRTIWRSCYMPETHPQKHITQLNNYLSHTQICGSPMASNIHENLQHWEHTDTCTSKLKIVRTLTPKTSIKRTKWDVLHTKFNVGYCSPWWGTTCYLNPNINDSQHKHNYNMVSRGDPIVHIDSHYSAQ